MKKHAQSVLTLLFLLLISPPLKAQVGKQEASVKITGEITTPYALKYSDAMQFPQVKVIRKDRDGKDHVYSGILLSDLLAKAGVTLRKELMGENMAKYVLIDASDGYQVVFALAELDKSFTDRRIILADEMDGKPLPEGDGPFRVIVEQEKKPARCIKQVTGIKILFAKTI